MAYGAVGCLELTIQRLLYSSHIAIAQNSSTQILKHLYEEILSLKEALRDFDTRRSTINMKMVKTLEAEMIDAVYQFEDVIDPHLSNQFHSQSEEEESIHHHPSMLFSVDLEEIQQVIDSFIQTIDKMKRAYIHELCNPSPDEEEDDARAVSSRIDFGGNDQSNMVGLSDLFMRIKCQLDSSQSEAMIISLVGMAGIGKTTLTKKLFLDRSISSSYSRRALVTIGPKYRLADILVDILKQVNVDIDETTLLKGEILLFDLKRMVFKSLKIPFLDKKESWYLLREKVFVVEPCSYEFEKAGKKIAENCEGLPLTIVTVANILSKGEKTIEYWNEVADDKQHSVYKDAYDQMSNVLYPSYDYLEQHLKACFLYVGAFPQNHRVDGYQVTNLWRAEGFLNSKPVHYLDPTMTSTNDTHGYVDDLLSKNIIMFDREKHGYYLHSSFWYMCNKEADKNKLFYVVSYRGDALPEEVIRYERRFCIRNNVLLAINDVHNSIAYVSTVRSLLCTGDFHEYPVSLCLEHLRLLRLIVALSIRFYEFPMEALKLVQLRYFALTYDGNLPTSISKLWNLQYLIIYRHLGIIKSNGNSSFLPTEIWNMKELKCLETTGRDLPHPCEGSLLPNLVRLTGVGPQSCEKYVLEKTPSLKVLSIKIDLPPDATEPLSCFDHISHLDELEELECAIVNPILKTEVITPLAPLSILPSLLIKLTLCGLGYPWEEMSKISSSSLPNLTHLTLQLYAFRGPKWEVHDKEFQSLLFLEIEDTDLEQWTIGNHSCFREIEVLRIAHCYKLQVIPLTFGTYLKNIHVVDCNTMAVNCANKLKQDWDDKYSDDLQRSLDLNVYSSWDDGKI